MVAEQSILVYFTEAGPVVKSVMGILLLASFASWAIIFQRYTYIRNTKRLIKKFEEQFWAGSDLSKLYSELHQDEENCQGMQTIFLAGFKEYIRLRKQEDVDPAVVMDGVQRAMRIASSREAENLESHLTFLATVGSTSPYIGLFGTVWGIMTAFHALGNVQQATIAMVAPGISEALVATAMGLFAAIPAVIAYNKFSSSVERTLNQYDTFQDEFSNILHRQAHVGAESN